MGSLGQVLAYIDVIREARRGFCCVLGVEGRGASDQPLSRDGAVWAWGPQRGKGKWSLSLLPDGKAACSNCPFRERRQKSREKWWA